MIQLIGAHVISNLAFFSAPKSSTRFRELLSKARAQKDSKFTFLDHHEDYDDHMKSVFIVLHGYFISL